MTPSSVVQIAVSAVLLGAAISGPATAQSVHNWTGFYIGGHVGYGSSALTYYDPAFQNWNLSHEPRGFVGGGQTGFNVQSGAWVAGIEFDFSGLGIDGGVIDTQPGFLNDRFDADTKWIGTLTGRLGLAFDRLLIYGEAGVARARTVAHFQFAPAPGYASARHNLIQNSFVAGGGIEYALTSNWSVKAEYNYIDFGRSGDVTFAPLPAGFVARIEQDMHLVKAGLNYRFGP